VWPIVPRQTLAMLNTATAAASQRAFAAMMKMAKLDIAALQGACESA
jgi:predicted 3-demethylubiquinone-9 3-methyltransferase (glyoxalase superfamily)